MTLLIYADSSFYITILTKFVVHLLTFADPFF